MQWCWLSRQAEQSPGEGLEALLELPVVLWLAANFAHVAWKGLPAQRMPFSNGKFLIFCTCFFHYKMEMMIMIIVYNSWEEDQNELMWVDSIMSCKELYSLNCLKFPWTLVLHSMSPSILWRRWHICSSFVIKFELNLFLSVAKFTFRSLWSLYWIAQQYYDRWNIHSLEHLKLYCFIFLKRTLFRMSGVFDIWSFFFLNSSIFLGKFHLKISCAISMCVCVYGKEIEWESTH